MSAYITTENQTLLWRLLNQIPSFIQKPEQEKASLFRKTIEQHYYENEHTDLSYDQLQDINKKTLMTVLYPPSIPSPSIPSPSIPSPSIPSPNDSPSPPVHPPSSVNSPMHMVETSEEKSIREYNERQQMYENMNTKPKLPNANELFQEPSKEDNEVITNMDELLEQYQIQRVLDISFSSPPPSIQSKLQHSTVVVTQETTENHVEHLEREIEKLRDLYGIIQEKVTNLEISMNAFKEKMLIDDIGEK